MDERNVGCDIILKPGVEAMRRRPPDPCPKEHRCELSHLQTSSSMGTMGNNWLGGNFPRLNGHNVDLLRNMRPRSPLHRVHFQRRRFLGLGLLVGLFEVEEPLHDTFRRWQVRIGVPILLEAFDEGYQLGVVVDENVGDALCFFGLATNILKM